ncbi:hypothetical protein F2Q69_00024967 [Brassica cretica]|uniref:CCHC-type domain-containing protein n=1 Tax=Brassica cretica TaxID=69181 RepID=A0A8S9Q9Y1_BRACR|nr:hypothetical protein F2Q69_00024967 [Brassica cretica]
MGEAKVLVEMELDRNFPKLIALNDKQGSIFLVQVDYSWIPSTCERCGRLGHKSKRCLLSSKPPENSSLSANSKGVGTDVPVVDIDIILQQTENVGENVGSLSSAFQEKEDTSGHKEQIYFLYLTAHIMETSPSNITNKEVQKTSNVAPLTTLSQASEFESPRFTVLDDADEADNEPPRSLSLARGGRETKPPIKYQDLE